MTDTLRGAALMTAAMAMFAVEDALIKSLAATFSPAQIIWMLGLGGTLAFALWLRLTGQTIWSPLYLNPQVMLRTAFEAGGSMFFVSALAVVPLALASAVIQATPLLVAMGAALFLGAEVGWRRWLAIIVGFGGVLIILRPAGDGFDPNTLLAVCGMVGLAARDLCTRTIPKTTSGARLSFIAFAALTGVGLGLHLIQQAPVQRPDPWQLAILSLCVIIGMAGYLAIVAGTRVGEIAVVSSFRYSRMIFALVIATIFFDENPDFWTLAGVSIVIASGIFTLVREARMRG